MLPGSKHVPLGPAEDWSILKDAVTRFEQAWRQGQRPEIEDYLPPGDPLDWRVLIELVHIELELRLKAGEPARVEEYLARYPVLANDRGAILELIVAERELRQRGEAALTLDEYLERFPQFRTELPERFLDLTVDDPDLSLRPLDPRGTVPPAPPGYEVLEFLGRGGMGVVYKARQQSLDRFVALKFLPEDCTRDPAWMARFRREARTASALNHPHICTIYDTGESAGRPFLSMEWIQGQTLETLIGQRRPVTDVVRLLGQAARALEAAHAAGVIHRDVKPGNLMVREDGIVKVLDFGLARRLSHDAGWAGKTTEPGAQIGTPLYMSPEQVKAAPVDAATDVFSMGVVLYELTTGQHPFRASSAWDVQSAIVTQSPVRPSRLNPEIPTVLEALILNTLAKEPGLRPSASEIAAALSQIGDKPSGGSGVWRGEPDHPPTVARERERAALRTSFEQAAAGRGSIVCVTGEPGLGKTTLVERFLDELVADKQTCKIARGRSSERLAGTEAYLPFLEALGGLLQGGGGPSEAQTMRLLAPSWYVQLAPLDADDSPLARVFADAKEAPQERRKRELGVFLDEVSRQCPLVLFLDDIHWADPSSVDLLAYIGSRCANWRLLVILTYRLSDLWRTQHLFGPVKLELQGRGVCSEIALPYLSREDIDRYLVLAFARHQFPQELGQILHSRTEGNPLFVVNLVHYLRDRGVIVQEHDSWKLVQAVPDLQTELPESVRGMIRRKIDQLSTADRDLLLAASVQGVEFDSAVAAQLLAQEALDVEEGLDSLEHVHHIVRFVREQTFPDGTLTLRYSFVHILYQNALYAALRPTRKAVWSKAAAQALLGHYGEKSDTLAADLAMLFEAGRDQESAVDHYLVAAEHAARMYAHHEAVALARRGLALLRTLADTPERARRELSLQMILGVQLQVAEGYAAPDAEHIYARAHELCAQMPEAAPLFPVLWGLWMYYEVRCKLDKSRELAQRLFLVAQAAQDPAQLLQARQALTITSFCLGNPVATREHMEQALGLYDPMQHHSHTHLYGQDPRVTCLAFGAVALWQLGYPDQAAQQSSKAVALGRELGQPSTIAFALHFAAILSQYRREGPAVQVSAEAVTEVATEHRFSFWRGGSRIMRGWVLAEQGDPVSGLVQVRQGLTEWMATGGETHRTYFLSLLAETLYRGGEIEEGLEVLTEALTLMARTGEGFHGAELHRLCGEFLLRHDEAEVWDAEAEACFWRALTVARGQQCKSLELRAATSLTRLYQKHGRQAEARPLLAECYNWFTEGFDTPDLRDAKTVLEMIS